MRYDENFYPFYPYRKLIIILVLLAVFAFFIIQLMFTDSTPPILAAPPLYPNSSVQYSGDSSSKSAILEGTNSCSTMFNSSNIQILFTADSLNKLEKFYTDYANKANLYTRNETADTQKTGEALCFAQDDSNNGAHPTNMIIFLDYNQDNNTVLSLFPNIPLNTNVVVILRGYHVTDP